MGSLMIYSQSAAALSVNGHEAKPAKSETKKNYVEHRSAPGVRQEARIVRPA
jgi:hypothetical protein